MNYTIQYQQFAEPVLPPSTTVSPIEGYAVFPDYVPTLPRKEPEYFSYDFGIATHETIYLDKWNPQYKDFTKLALAGQEQVQSFTPFVPVTPAAPTKGYAIFPDQVLKKTSIQQQYASVPFVLSTISLLVRPVYPDSVKQKVAQNTGNTVNPYVFSAALPVQFYPRFVDSIIRKPTLNGAAYSFTELTTKTVIEILSYYPDKLNRIGLNIEGVIALIRNVIPFIGIPQRGFLVQPKIQYYTAGMRRVMYVPQRINLFSANPENSFNMQGKIKQWNV
jgi:hypothetical protein